MDIRPKGGRRNRAAFALVDGMADHLRPDPPDFLSDEEAAEWIPIVARMPPQWFTAELWPLLSAYCQHIVLAKEIMEQIRAIKLDADAEIKVIKANAMLRAMLVREHRVMITLATKMRLTPTSKYETVAQENQKDRQPKFRQPFQVDNSAA
jgi:phage terminase small subunit